MEWHKTVFSLVHKIRLVLEINTFIALNLISKSKHDNQIYNQKNIVVWLTDFIENVAEIN